MAGPDFDFECDDEFDGEELDFDPWDEDEYDGQPDEMQEWEGLADSGYGTDEDYGCYGGDDW